MNTQRLLRRQPTQSRVLTLSALILLAAGLRLHGLTVRGFWADELFTARFAAAANTWGEVAQRALHTPIPSPPLWFWITHAFVLVLGEGEMAVRLPSAFAGILGVPALYALGRRLFDARTGLVAALLLALSPLHIYHSQEARFYAVVPLLSTFSLYYLWQGLTRGGTRWWAGFVLATLASMYIHLTTFLVLAAEVTFAVGYLGTRRSPSAPRTARRLGLALAVITVAYAPMIPYLLQGATGARGLGNPGVLYGFSLSPAYLALLGGLFGAGLGVALSLYGAAFLWGLAHMVQHRRAQAALVITWTCAPFLVIWLLRPKHWFVPKYVISILPIYLLAVAWGLHQVERSLVGLRPRLRLAIGFIGVILIVALNASAIREVYTFDATPWRDLARILRANARPGDVFIFTPLRIITMSPQEMLAYYYHPEEAGVFTVTATSADEVARLVEERDRVWLVFPHRWQQRGKASLLPEGFAYVSLDLPHGGELLYLRRGETREDLLAAAMHFVDLPASAWGSIGEAYEEMGRASEAIAAYARAAAAAPDEGMWPYRMALVYEQQGRLEQAREAYERAVDLSPDVPGFHAALGDFRARTGDVTGAIRAYRRAITLYTRQYPGDTSSPYLKVWQGALAQQEIIMAQQSP